MNFKLNIIVSALDLSLWSSCARGGYALHDSYVDGTINVGNSSAAMMLSIGTYGTKITSAHDPKHKLYVMDASDDGTYNTGVVNTNEKMPIQNTASQDYEHAHYPKNHAVVNNVKLPELVPIRENIPSEVSKDVKGRDLETPSFPTFVSRDLLAPPLRTEGIAVVDLNGDSHVDIVRVNWDWAFDQILFNDGLGNFTLNNIPDTNYILTSAVAVHDVNGDGSIDIVLANWDGPSKLLLNDGTGNFTSFNLPYHTGHCTNVAVGDMNADGLMDIIITFQDSPIKLLLNDGAGLFIESDLPFDVSTESIALGDINEDGFVDILVNDALLLNDGTGNFTLTSFFSESPILLGDVNGDNHLDIVCGGSMLLLNNGAGGFPSVIYLPGERKRTSSTAIADVDNDGHTDIILGNFGKNQLLLNDGAGDFEVYDLPGFIRRTSAIAVIDANSDDQLDIITGDYGKSLLLINDGVRAHFTITDLPGGSVEGDGEQDVAVGDLNHDGYLDIVIADVLGVQFLSNNGKGGFISTDLPVNSSWYYAVALGDMTGDGICDIVLSHFKGNILLLNDGMGNFTSMDLMSDREENVHYVAKDIALNDMSGDGLVDIVLANGWGGNQILLNHGDGTFLASDLPGSCQSASVVSLDDINADGQIDIVFGCPYGASQLLLNDGNGISFVAYDLQLPPQDIRDIALGDVNGDGFVDIVATSYDRGLQLLLNDGLGNFTDNITLPLIGGSSIALKDMNNDGHIDIVVPTFSGHNLLMNDGTGNFSVVAFPGRTSSSEEQIAVADIDGDGRNDILQISYFANQIMLNKGNSKELKFDDLIGKTINASCAIINEASTLLCSASTDAVASSSLSGILMTSLEEGFCFAGFPASAEGSQKYIALAVDATCKNSGTCRFKHCFRADFVIAGTSVIAKMFEVDSTITYNKDGTFLISIQTGEFNGTGATAAAMVTPYVTASLGKCGSTENLTLLEVGNTAAICVTSPSPVGLSLKSVTANPGGQILVNEVGETNFVSLLTNQGTNQVTLETLMIPAYFDAQGGNKGYITITGTAMISYTARRHLMSGGSLFGLMNEEAPFDLNVPLVAGGNDIPEVVHFELEEESAGYHLDLCFGYGVVLVHVMTMVFSLLF